MAKLTISIPGAFLLFVFRYLIIGILRLLKEQFLCIRFAALDYRGMFS